MERIGRGQNPPPWQNPPTVDLYIDQVLYFQDFVIGKILLLQEFHLLFPVNVHFFPTTTIPYSKYIITVNIHIDQVLYFLGFCVLGRFCPNTNFTFFSRRPIKLTLSTEQIMFWGDFAPGKILSRVGFSPMIYHSITLNIHQDQVMYFFFRIFCHWGISSQQELYLLQCKPLQLRFM